MSANLEDLYVEHVLQHFNLLLFLNKGDEETDSLSFRRRGF